MFRSKANRRRSTSPAKTKLLRKKSAQAGSKLK